MAPSIRVLIGAALVTVTACSSRPAETASRPLTPATVAPPRAVRTRTDPDPGWPRSIVDGHGWRVTAYQPQVERFVGGQLTARVAVVAVPPSSAPRYAVFVLRARAAVDKRERLVMLDDIAIERAQSAQAARAQPEPQ